MWKITKNHLVPDKEGYLNPKEDIFTNVNIESSNFRSNVLLPFEFKIYDDDNQIYYSGFANSCDDQKAFSPLDSYAGPNDGCTYIKYKNPDTNQWVTL